MGWDDYISNCTIVLFLSWEARRATIGVFCPTFNGFNGFMSNPEYILTLSCLDQRGIVHRVSGFLAEHGCNIIDSAQFGDSESQLFFMRVHFAREDRDVSDELLRADFACSPPT
jgi:predicted amino acid-binding ACT domain protein